MISFILTSVENFKLDLVLMTLLYEDDKIVSLNIILNIIYKIYINHIIYIKAK